MRQVFSQGWLWLLLAAAVPTAVMLNQPPEEYVGRWPDSPEYIEIARKDVLDGDNLNHFRTWGFPLFLQALEYVHPDPEWLWLPPIQLALHVLAVLLLYAGLRQAGLPALASVLACLPVMLTDSVLVQRSVNQLLTDSLAHSLVLASLGLFFVVLARPGWWWCWAALALCVFGAYQVRPAFQGLLVVLPAAGWLLRGRVARPRAFVAALVAVCFVPWLAFCGWRWHVVGDFNLVSFTGTNLVGITGVIVTEDMIPQLDPEDRPFAEWIVTRRVQPDVRRWRYYNWMPPVPEGGSAWDLALDHVYYQYDEMVWQICYYGYMGPATDYNQVEIDRRFRHFALGVIRAAPDLYAAVVLQGLTRGVIYATVGRHSSRAALYLFVGGLLIAGLARAASGWLPLRADPAAARQDARWLVLVAAPALLLWLVETLLTVLVAMPDPRYLDPPAVLLPGVLTTALYIMVRRLWPTACPTADKCH
jgi:hypothetical protein